MAISCCGLIAIDPGSRNYQATPTGPRQDSAHDADSKSGKKLKGKASKRLCGIKANKKRGRVMVKPACSAGLKYTAKITVKGNSYTKRTWQRTWKVKNKPRVSCALRGTG